MRKLQIIKKFLNSLGFSVSGLEFHKKVSKFVGVFGCNGYKTFKSLEIRRGFRLIANFNPIPQFYSYNTHVRIFTIGDYYREKDGVLGLLWLRVTA